jgi:hypothetical protein
MKRKYLYLFVLLCPLALLAQLKEYRVQMPLSPVSDTWHTVKLPTSVFDDVKNDFSDIRIYGTTEKDTIEVPYVLCSSGPTGIASVLEFELINSTSNSSGYFYTYAVLVNKPINEMELSFENENFNWNVTLEGSQDQKQWFTILEDYRILSIQNEQTNYTFTDLTFPDADYTYYRIHIKTGDIPQLKSSSIRLNKNVPATYVDYNTEDINITQKGKTTQIDIDLKGRFPTTYLKVNIRDDYDFYRPISVSYVIDSAKTEKGWKYSYQNLFTGTLTSLEKKGFSFKNTMLGKVHISIQHYDNPSLKIESVYLKGYSYELIGRFTEPAKYYLAYGNPRAYAPKYDLQQTGFELPENSTSLALGKAENIDKPTTAIQAPIFENKWWLWCIMGLIILVLGGATLKMMKEKG